MLPYDARLILARPCPNCGATDESTPVLTADRPAEAMSWEELQHCWEEGATPTSCFFSYRRCASCGQLFSGIYLTEAALDVLYGNSGDNLLSGDRTSSAATQAEYAARIAHFTNGVRRYLELGPDIGLLSGEIGRRFHPAAAFLVEPKRTVWPQLKEVFPSGVASIVSHLSELEHIEDGSINLAVAVHVLHHIPYPREVLGWLRRKLAQDAILVLVEHNEQSALAKVLGRRWDPYSLQHPQLFNSSSLSGMLTRESFSVVAIEPTRNYFPLGFLLTHAMVALLRIKMELSFLRWPVIRLPLGNIMAVAAKRGA